MRSYSLIALCLLGLITIAPASSFAQSAPPVFQIDPELREKMGSSSAGVIESSMVLGGNYCVYTKFVGCDRKSGAAKYVGSIMNLVLDGPFFQDPASAPYVAALVTSLNNYCADLTEYNLSLGSRKCQATGEIGEVPIFVAPVIDFTE